ncbi:MAG: DUF6599 family protein [Acidobacteriaceae bacterium]
MAFPLRSVGRFAGLAVCSLLFAASSVLFAQTPIPVSIKPPASESILPAHFSGWVEHGTAKTGTAPQSADPANADALSEYGLKIFADATYHQGAAVAHVRAMRFDDATGAYGAFTFYRKPGMSAKAVGKGGAGNAHEIVFWAGTTAVDVTFGSSGAPSQSALKSLASTLPPALGSTGVPPSLPSYLPAGFDLSSVHYAIGPAAFVKSGGILPASVISFSRDAEVVTARYDLHGSRGTLTLIEYPTPQMAVEAEKAMNALLKGPLPESMKGSSPSALAVRRSGPIVAMTSGQFSASEAQSLLGKLTYRAEVTWSHPTSGESEVKKAAQMLIGIAYLTGILVLCALVLAAFLSGGRVLWRTVRGKPASSVYEEDFISLNLSGWNPGAPRKMP